jgi:hypothetical protein
MNDLIEALQILAKYARPDRPTHCEHDELTINPEIDPSEVSPEDIERLYALGFFVTDEDGEECFKSFRFGRC